MWSYRICNCVLRISLHNFATAVGALVFKPEKKSANQDKLGNKADKWTNQGGLLEANNIILKSLKIIIS